MLRRAARHRGDCLDVGCGDGLLLQRLAPAARTVTGIDVDKQATTRARRRIAQFANVTVKRISFDDFDPGSSGFDVITFVASIHHMDLPSALQKARFLLVPRGELLIVGLAANKSIADWAIAGLVLPFAYACSRLHRETRNIGVRIAEPQQSLGEITATARRLLPVSRSAVICTTDIYFGGASPAHKIIDARPSTWISGGNSARTVLATPLMAVR